ncbi:MAG TPA: His/Gly/Thr/Pro-type tRNA ligase C-terminal domain-containing protein, partial [Methanobacterium sp.]|nr:His/Gly/Thr/Pro-type tRNA ligase C-terminal domain-containing protein [Methanobacterium sp.]
VGRKLKKILNQANNLQVDYVILVGERDLKEGKVTVKNMESGEQELVEIESVTQMMIDLLK